MLLKGNIGSTQACGRLVLMRLWESVRTSVDGVVDQCTDEVVGEIRGGTGVQ